MRRPAARRPPPTAHRPAWRWRPPRPGRSSPARRCGPPYPLGRARRDRPRVTRSPPARAAAVRVAAAAASTRASVAMTDRRGRPRAFVVVTTAVATFLVVLALLA